MKTTKLTFQTSDEIEVTLSNMSIDSGLFLSMKLEAFGDYEYCTAPVKSLILDHIRSRERQKEVDAIATVLQELLLEANKVKGGLLPERFEAPDMMPA